MFPHILHQKLTSNQLNLSYTIFVMLNEEIIPVNPNIESQDIQHLPMHDIEPIPLQNLPSQNNKDETALPADPAFLTNTGEANTLWKKFRMNHSVTIYKIIAIALTIQGLIGIYKSVTFIMVEYPDLEIQLENHSITENQINNFASKAVVIGGSTILSMFFALRISIIQSKTAKRISAFIGAVLFVANTWVNNYLNQLGSAEFITQMFFSTLDKIKKLMP
jgi:hypothetical protein